MNNLRCRTFVESELSNQLDFMKHIQSSLTDNIFNEIEKQYGYKRNDITVYDRLGKYTLSVDGVVIGELKLSFRYENDDFKHNQVSVYLEFTPATTQL